VESTRTNLDRIKSSATIQQLTEELLIAFPRAVATPSPTRTEEPPHLNPANQDSRSHVTWEASRGLLHAVLYGADEDPSTVTISLRPVQPPHAIDLKLANAYVRVFNEDVRATPNLLRHQELWETLAASRVPRAIARLTAFSTTPFLSWLTTMEAATHLRYEGVPFRSIVLMSKQHEWISGPVGDGYIAFKRPLGFSQALIEEKWIRAISASTEVGLHGLGHSGNIVGIVALSTDASISSGGAVLPTELQPIASLVRAGTMAFVCAPNGDLYVVLPSGAVFVKSQGSWHYQNFSSFQSLLSKYVPQPIAQPLLRLLLDLSYKRKGALFCVPADLSTVEQLVPDHTNSRRANFALRQAVSGLQIDTKAHRKVLLAAAAVDGAIVISNAGAVVDVACMIGEPGPEALAHSGHSQLTRFAGARSTAAWNASIYGLGIKVSEDGPISVFSKGHLVGQLG
jgi:hypothetical protein